MKEDDKMEEKLIIYHGSDHIIEVPEYGKGKKYNDYGLGFYCTEYIELAKEWACSDINGGYANKYVLDMTGLKVLDLNSKDYCILHWISILLKNRKFTIDSELGNSAREYILKNFPVDVDGYDVIKEKSYSSNRISGITSSVGGFIVDGASFVVDTIQGVVKAFIG